MGMAASQARLLSITARLTNNENSGQSISYSKQRLADQTQQITNEYNEALSATKLTVLTGFNGADASYTDISYNLMTGPEMASNVKQYVVTDTKGRVLVTETLAEKYEQSKGNYNQFLANLGYSQADITVQKDSDDEEAKKQAEQQIHEAWDAYFSTVGINLGDNEHDFGFSWTETVDAQGNYAIGQGYAGYMRTDENGNPVDKDGNLAYLTNEDGKFVDSAGNVVKEDIYTDETQYANNQKNYYDEFGDLISKDIYSETIENNANGYTKVYYYESGTEVPKDAYADESQYADDTKYVKRYYQNGVLVDFDNDTKDGYKKETLEKFQKDSSYTYKYLTIDDSKVVPYDSYSEDVKNNSNYKYKYFNGDTEIAYDAYSENITGNPNFTYKYVADGKEIPYDGYSKDAYSQMAIDTSKVVYDPINYEGTTDEQRELYDYAMSLTEAYLRVNEGANKNFNVTYDMSLVQSASNSENASMIKYYQNIFNKMQSCGYFTYTTTAAKAAADPEHYIYAYIGTGTAVNVQKSPLKDNTAFEKALREGTLRLEYYSTTDKEFVSTTISEDTCIQEVADERAIAQAESKYNQDMTDLENKDKKLDLELKKLDTEHSALQTEYDSIKNVVDKNVENSFKTFG